MTNEKCKRLFNKGVTITSLTIYVIVATILVGVLLFLNLQFFSNINELTKEANINGNKLQFKSAFLGDLKSNVAISEYSNNRIKLDNNVSWEVRELSDVNNDTPSYAVFRNDVKLVDYVIKNPMTNNTLNNRPYSFFDYDADANFLKTNWAYYDGNKIDYEYSSYLVGTTSNFSLNKDKFTTIPPDIVVNPTVSPTTSTTPRPTLPPYPTNSYIEVDAEHDENSASPGSDFNFKLLLSKEGNVTFPYQIDLELKAVDLNGEIIDDGNPLGISGVSQSADGTYKITIIVPSEASLRDSSFNPKEYVVSLNRTLQAGSLILTNTLRSNILFTIPVKQNVKIKMPSKKNIVMLLDTSESMNYCLTHTLNDDAHDIDDYIIPTISATYHNYEFKFDSAREMLCKKCGRIDVREKGDRVCAVHGDESINYDSYNERYYCQECVDEYLYRNGTNYICRIHGTNTTASDRTRAVYYCRNCAVENITTKSCNVSSHGTKYIKNDDYCYKCGLDYPSRLKALKEKVHDFAEDIIDANSDNSITFTIIDYNTYVTVRDTLRNPSIDDVSSILENLRAVGSNFVDEGVSEVISTFNSSARMLEDATNVFVFLSNGNAASSHEIRNSTLQSFRGLETETYAIGFGNTYATSEINKLTNNESSRKYTARDDDELEDVLQSIADKIIALEVLYDYTEVTLNANQMYPVKLEATTWANQNNVETLGTANNQSQLSSLFITVDVNGRINIDFSKYPQYTNFVVSIGQNPG